MIPRILVSGKHVNFVKIDTTGLDPMNSEMIGIVIARGHFKDNVLIPVKCMLIFFIFYLRKSIQIQ